MGCAGRAVEIDPWSIWRLADKIEKLIDRPEIKLID
jgi:hypothetical protein